jgi:cytochrome P450
VATQTDQINGVRIPKGAILWISILAIHFDEEVWGPDVDTFNPDRWDNLPETVSQYDFLTFILGPRNCIGRKFAELEMKVLLAKLVQKLRFEEVVKGRKVRKKSMITTRPQGGMFLNVSAV